MAKLTQCERILRHMEDYGTIDPMVAIKEYGCMRLASRIADLKDMGIDIIAERTKGKNRYGEQTSYCVYRLANKEVTSKSFMTDNKQLIDKVAIEMIERQIKAGQCIANDCKDAKAIKFLGVDKPIIRSCKEQKQEVNINA